MMDIAPSGTSAGDTDLKSILDTVYGAVEKPSLWGDALRQIACAVDAEGATLTGVHPHQQAITFSLTYGLPPEMADELRLHATANPRTTAMRVAGPTKLCVDRDHIADHEMVHSSYYRDVLLKHGHGYYAGALLDCGPLDEVAFSVLRRRNQGPFDDAQLGLIRDVIPHVQRAVALSLQIESLSRRMVLGRAVLNRMNVGVIAICFEGRIAMTNEAADRMLDAEDGIQRRGRELRAQRLPDDIKLQHLIATARKCVVGSDDASATTALIARRSGLQPYTVSVFRWDPPSAVFGALPKVLVLIRDAATIPVQSEEHIASLLGLTAAESRLAKRLLEGGRLQAAATDLGISQNTARSQLRSIFDKTDTRRQVDLIRLLTLTFDMSSR